MTMRVDRFVVSLALACLCSCATTKPDSTDSASSLIELPEQQKKQNEDKCLSVSVVVVDPNLSVLSV